MRGIESYVCVMYRFPKLSSVNEARQATVNMIYVLKNNDQPFEKLRGIDACINSSLFPLHYDTLCEKVKCIINAVSMWKHANTQNPVVFESCRQGYRQNQVVQGQLNAR